MIKEAAHTTIGNLKDIPNENNKIVESNKKKLIEDQQNIGQDS